MRCSLCDRAAIATQRASMRHLCQDHFVEDFQARVKDTLNRERMVGDKERIAVALSGGKDSSALLFVLAKILEERKGVEIFAVTIDEGIEGYREETVRSAKKLASDVGVEHAVVSFKDHFGMGLDEIIGGKKEAPCTYCGVFRKALLNMTAKGMGASKVATGHDLDDEAQTVLMNYLKGDIERMARLYPRKTQQGLVPRIKPLKEIPEREVALYSMVNGLYSKMVDCPYAQLSLRGDVRNMLNELEVECPGTKASIIRGFKKVSEPLNRKYLQAELSRCISCGEPCIGETCKACQLLGRVRAGLNVQAQ